jgi:type II secretory pathway pseudopilin PulG
MKLPIAKYPNFQAFTLAEVLVAVAVAVIFGVAAFATNERLLIALKNQKETTAASMMLQERMEKFRGFSYSNIADQTYVNTNVVQAKTTSEAALGNVSETITVSGYMNTGGGIRNYPSDGTHANQWVRNTSYPNGNQTDTNTSLATDNDLLKVDILLTWTSANGRTRTRDLASVFGKGNIGP